MKKQYMSQHLVHRSTRHIGLAPGEFIRLLPLQPMMPPDPWKDEVTRDPIHPNIFQRPSFTEGKYQQHVKPKQRKSNES